MRQRLVGRQHDAASPGRESMYSWQQFWSGRDGGLLMGGGYAMSISQEGAVAYRMLWQGHVLAAVDEGVERGNRGVLALLTACNDLTKGAAEGENALVAEQLVVSQTLHVSLQPSQITPHLYEKSPLVNCAALKMGRLPWTLCSLPMCKVAC